MLLLLTTFVITLLTSLVLTRVIRDLFRRWQFVDKPDGKRKIQSEAISLGGGLAIFLACVAGLSVIALTRFHWDWEEIQRQFARDPDNLPLLNFLQIGLLFAAAGVLCLVGLYDDRYHLRGRTKLLWQILACSIIVYVPHWGLYFNKFTLFGTIYQLDVLGPPLTLAWLLLSINSFNLIDGVDGLAGTLGTVFALTFGCIALVMGNVVDGMVAFILVAAILGFLRYNYNPATIYMGDAGSMFIGLVLGTLAIRCSIKGQAVSMFAVPLAVWAIPILDSSMAILRRKLTGRSIYATDRGHIHHRLLTCGLSPRQTVLLLGGLSLITSIGAVLTVYYGYEWLSYICIGAVFTILIASRLFGHVELLLLNSKVIGLGRTIMGWSDPLNKHQVSHQLQGKLQWEEKIWFALVEAADRFGLINLRLNLYLPHLHEDFHATWKSPHDTDAQQTWRMELPLVAGEMIIGSLGVTGIQPANSSASARLTEFLDFLEPLEAQLAQILALPAPKPAAPRTSSLITEPVTDYGSAGLAKS